MKRECRENIPEHLMKSLEYLNSKVKKGEPKHPCRKNKPPKDATKSLRVNIYGGLVINHSFISESLEHDVKKIRQPPPLIYIDLP